MEEFDSILKVSELSRQVRLSLERVFPLQWVAGEVSNLARAASGHFYFSLKDEASQVKCVMFRSRAQTLPWRLENGQQVEVRALVSLYEPRGEFQLGVEEMRRAGLGKLFEAFARLREKLGAEGLFAEGRKRSIPRFPRAIGIISSPQAAALGDVIAAIRRRAAHVPIVLYPCAVQGAGAGESIASALAAAGTRMDCDLLLVVRGGGSIEDLWAFNEEVVARALSACPLPTISGIGHETDITIADFVADLRAATPTAAAELATAGWHQSVSELRELGNSLTRSTEYRLTSAQQSLDRLALRLVHPAVRIERYAETVKLLASRIKASASGQFGRLQTDLNRAALTLLRRAPRTDQHRTAASLLAQRLEASQSRLHAGRVATIDRIAAAFGHLNPDAILARGYAIVRDQDGSIVADAQLLSPGQIVNVRFANGEADASVLASRTGKSLHI